MAAKLYGSTGLVSAETKYDGERMQIHLELPASFSSSTPSSTSANASGRLGGKARAEDEIKLWIYSKSGRNSTWDRFQMHPLIFAALGMAPTLAARVAGHEPDLHEVEPLDWELLLERITEVEKQEQAPFGEARAQASKRSPPRRSVVLEGEMVAWDETRGHVAEFYKIQRLKNEQGERLAVRSKYHPSRFLSGAGQTRIDDAAAERSKQELENMRAKRVEKIRQKQAESREEIRRQILQDIEMGLEVEDMDAEIEKRLER